MPEPTNELRAFWAAKAVDAFCAETGQNLEEDPYKEVIGDLLCDLRHLCDRCGVDFDDCAGKSKVTYQEEVAEEEEEEEDEEDG